MQTIQTPFGNITIRKEKYEQTVITQGYDMIRIDSEDVLMLIAALAEEARDR